MSYASKLRNLKADSISYKNSMGKPNWFLDLLILVMEALYGFYIVLKAYTYSASHWLKYNLKSAAQLDADVQYKDAKGRIWTVISVHDHGAWMYTVLLDGQAWKEFVGKAKWQKFIENYKIVKWRQW